MTYQENLKLLTEANEELGKLEPESEEWYRQRTKVNNLRTCLLYYNDLPGDEPMETSELKVMKSAAGYYLGRSYKDREVNVDLPYSRESDYFDTHDLAQDFLDHLNNHNEAGE